MVAQGEVSGHFVEQGPGAWSPLPQESTPVFQCIVADDEAGAGALFADNPDLLNEQLTLLYWAAEPGKAAAAERASVQVRQRTPLALAAQCGAVGVMSLLLRKGADVLAKASGQTALEVAMDSSARNKAAIVELLKEATTRQLQQQQQQQLDPSASSAATDAQSEAAAPFGSLDLAAPHRRTTQDVEGDASNPEGFPYSTSELTMPEYSTDDFRMYHFKVTRCSKKYTHDWRSCPFAHPTENARRRDPREFRYCSIACPDYKQGFCIRGDTCEFAHGVFEGWLHPARYRTQLCKDGANCHRPVCFFAHCLSELRTPTSTWTPGDGELSAAGAMAAPFALPQGVPTHSSSKTPSEGAPDGQPAKPKHPASPASVMAYEELDMGAGGFLEIGEASRKPDPEGSLSYGGSHGGASASEMPAGAGFLGGHHAPGSRGQHHRGQGGPGPRQVPRPRPPAPLSSTAAINAMARGEMLLGFTTPRMSNSFARRHGLNPKDNAMLNLQKLAIQAQQQAAPLGRWGEELPHSGYQGAKQGYGRPMGQGGGRQAGWQASSSNMPGVPQMAPLHGSGMYGMVPQGYGGMGHSMMPGMPGMQAMQAMHHTGGSADAASVAALNQSLMALGLHHHPHGVSSAPSSAAGVPGFGSGMPLGSGYGGYQSQGSSGQA